MQLMGESVALADLVIRPARPGDRDAYVNAVNALSSRSKFQRFFTPNPSLRERDVDRLLDLDPARQAVWLALDPSERIGLGAARYAMVGPDSAEVALAVLDAWQGRGLGGALMDRVIAGARDRGLATLVAESLDDNAAIAGLLRSRGFSAIGPIRGVVSWRLALATSAPCPPPLRSLSGSALPHR